MHAICYFQRLANSHITEAQNAFLELVDTILSRPGAWHQGRNTFMRITFA